MPIPAAAPPLIPDLVADGDEVLAGGDVVLTVDPVGLEFVFELDLLVGDGWEAVVDELVVVPLLTAEFEATEAGGDPCGRRFS